MEIIVQNTHLVIIDPQFDFCDPTGALFVPGADEDIKRLSAFINANIKKISDIHVTLDSHHDIDVAHPVFWRDSSGKNPDPFTLITYDDVKAGTWHTAKPGLQKRMLAYVKSLQDNGRYPLCIWPPHCLIGSKGYQVVEELYAAMQAWSRERFKTIDFVTKGSNLFTEHYSAVQADVPDPQDPTTQINTGFIQTLMDADEVLVAGEASSHCLANTVRDVANNFGDDSYVKKLTLFEDGTSAVPGFEDLTDDFVKEMTGRGMKITKTTEWMKSTPVNV
jgi:nicotinamidase-related amidase